MKNVVSIVAIVALLIAITTVEVDVRINSPVGPPRIQRVRLVTYLVTAVKAASAALWVIPFLEPAPEQMADNRAYQMTVSHEPPSRVMGADGYHEIDNGEGW